MTEVLLYFFNCSGPYIREIERAVGPPEAWSKTLRCCLKWIMLLSSDSNSFSSNGMICHILSVLDFVSFTWSEEDKQYYSDSDIPLEDDKLVQSLQLPTSLLRCFFLQILLKILI